ncbi:U3 snoRNP protein [Friedmanniomyces endolithicus]|uniref:U3 small nucleolar RNA-associated protein 22 n=1 Tax=Friedmanniomyces endolithicus TaxID=329885 RepID=A0AAN6JY95_9PEZI|nr:U3 snoRNP protein [Friedmanniomyces endolithicus]KAK0953850.1 U3 snoRNP protein [Friedmanniomyces endolithicus]KAK1003743.1 U3 snoRNP protein [Friedmanniomyces endolithicus]
MAANGVKRRKLEHTSSDDGDVVSFASFGATEEEVAEPAGNAGQDKTLEAVDDGDERLGDEEEEGFGDHEGDEQDLERFANHSEEDRGDVEIDVRDGGRFPKGKPAEPGAEQQRQDRAEGTRVRKTASELGTYLAGTSRSNIFKLQVDELLEQIRPRRGKREEAAEKALHSLKKILDQMPARGPLSVSDAEQQFLISGKVIIPFAEPTPPKDAKYKFAFASPSSVNVVGSYALKTSPRSREAVEIDMMVNMPAALFEEKDYLNYRYFYKRAYYLACLAESILDKSTYDTRFVDLHDDQMKPVVVVSPRTPLDTEDEIKPTPRWRINIIPSVGAEVFSKDKITPGRNCIRTTGDTKAGPTPFYNSSLRANMLTPSYLKVLHHAASTCDGFRDACLLGSTWLRQRGYSARISEGGFGNFEWSTLIALLLQGGGSNGKPMLSEGYSSYQLFKATLQVLALRNLSKSALVVGNADTKPTGDGTPMLWDALRAHNVLYKVTPWAYAQLRQDARSSLAMLGDQLFDGFDAAFILRTDGPLLQNDYLVNIPVTTMPAHRGSYHKLFDALKRGLGDRVSLVTMKTAPSMSWQPGSLRSKSTPDTSISIGLIVNPETVNRTVDHGPPAEDKAEAASFRTFWGEKAELRRFKDGSITESLVWSTSEAGQTVLEQVVRFLLSRHVGRDAEQNASFVGNGFVRLLPQGTSTTAYQPLMEAYKQLETDIRGLEGMPLSVRHITPADPQLRYCSIRPPSDTGGRKRPSPANVVIQFEASTRWPDEVIAIQRTKIAFLLNISELLQEAKAAVTARVGLENQEDESLNQAYLDIIYESGAAFRMRIHHDREQILLERQLKDKSLAPSSREGTARALAAYKRDYIKLPAHTQAVARLCSRYPALSGTVRLLKKWFASHLLASHIAEEVIELIAVRAFVQPWLWQTPSSVQTGFLRALHWLARWDWRAEPLIVDLSGTGELRAADVQSIKTRFEAWRKLDPSLNRIVTFAASSLDQDGTTWTDGRPQRVVAGHMTALAKAACAEVQEKQVALEPASLFASPLRDYDFVLHLDPALRGGKKRAGATNGTTFKNLELAAEDDESMIGFDAAQLLLGKLEFSYGSAVVFFAGGRERPVIAGLWSPQTAPRNWKMNLAYSTIPRKVRSKEEEESVTAEINKDAILAEIARLGGDLVESIERDMP